MRAIDLYSGVGGWSLGLKMAGIDVVDSYERWAPANETNFRNNGHHANLVDIRTLELHRLPENIDVVVGSPPCTQFSLSNRGGKGDFADGLVDIVRFLTIVDHVRPQFWAMENVPRVAKLIRHELKPGGILAKFAHLGCDVRVINMEEYGLPQRRHRCIAGNLDFDLLATYAAATHRLTLGEIVRALAAPEIVDPIYGTRVAVLHDHHVEEALNAEERRLNEAAKTIHPVYNSMSFPDPLDRSVRTITATCTRVSRESVIIPDLANSKELRRLTIRERASLQGFPIAFQFHGTSHGQKLKMVGNAVPPLFSFYLGQVMQGVEAGVLKTPGQGILAFVPPSVPPPETTLERAGVKYPTKRTFRMAIPSLRLKSGVRFELANAFVDENPNWAVSFVFGNSTDIQNLSVDEKTASTLRPLLPSGGLASQRLEALAQILALVDLNGLQRVWSRKGPAATHPFALLDMLDEAGILIKDALSNDAGNTKVALERSLEEQLGANWASVTGVAKLLRNAPLIVAGLLVGGVANAALKTSQIVPMSRATGRVISR